jgi:cystathionine beta-lyase
MEIQQRSAAQIAEWLIEQPDITRVYYPTLASHPGREVHLRQASGGGAVVSFELKDGETAKEFMRQVKLPLLGVSLGGVESILSYPATMSHAAMPPEERAARGISDALVRLSVGLEDAVDLIEDLRQALDRVR